MQLNNWKIFDKQGSPLNWSPDAYLPLTFSSDVSAAGASGYLITDPSGRIVDAEITNSGFFYSTGTTVSYEYVFGTDGAVDITSDVSINYIDVSIFNPTGVNTQGILSLDPIDISTLNLSYPSTTYSSAIFLNPVSQGLVETEHLFIFEEIDSSLVRPYDTSNGTLIFQMYGEDNEISFFTVDEDTQEITWTDKLEYTLDEWADSIPLTLNIGFRSEEEGVYERFIRVFNKVGTQYYLMGEILVNAESIGEDERFRTLLANFGLPDPINIPHLFKEADINEALPDFQIINPKSKLMILAHNEIMPFIGTYKALINALKWLGYDDIYVREWFKNVKENKKLSLIVPFNAADRTQTILKFSPDERKVLKKLNQLSLNYCLTRETGEIDDWGTPETENCYTYNIKEVFIKLLSLKTWLEKNIIGVNARIIDLTGEGIYFERYTNLIYATDNIGYNYYDQESVSPLTNPTLSELVQGEASINMSLLEFSRMKIKDLNYKFSDFIDYIWNPNDPSVTLSPTDASYLADPSSYLAVGAPISHPFVSLKDIQWKASVSKPYSGVLPATHVTNPLWVYDNNIRFYNIFDSSSVFFDSSVNVDLVIEKAFIRETNDTNWVDSLAYSIYPDQHLNMDASSVKLLTVDGSYAIISGSGTVYDASKNFTFNTTIDTDPSYFTVDGSIFIIADTSTVIETGIYNRWILESSLGVTWIFDDYVNLSADASSLLEYAIDSSYGVPLLSFKNFKAIDASESVITFDTDKSYFINIIDGKIAMDASVSPDLRYYINFQYDIDNEKQLIELNAEYISDRMPIYVIDPSVYYWADSSALNGNNDPSILAIDNSIYSLTVNHIGSYVIEAFAQDGYNVTFYNRARKNHKVYIKHPTLYTLIDNSLNVNDICSSTYMSQADVNTLIAQNSLPIFERQDKFNGLTMETDVNGNVYINAPSITYFHELPESGSINKFYNLTEKVSSIVDSSITINTTYQDFIIGDDVKLVYFDKGSYFMLSEASTHITNVTGNVLAVDNVPSGFTIDASHDVYLLNDTYRFTENASNHYDTNTFTLDISGYTFIDNQLVSLIINDVCTGYYYGSAFRVSNIDGSTHTFSHLMPTFVVNDPSRYAITAKHGFSTFANYSIDVSASIDSADNFELYYGREYIPNVIDNTFVMMNPSFDFDNVREMWYDTSLALVNSEFYYYKNYIEVDTSTLVIFKAQYDNSIYLTNQKNIWTVVDKDSSTLIFKAFNDSVPIVLDSTFDYSITAESYDSYGNLSSTE